MELGTTILAVLGGAVGGAIIKHFSDSWVFNRQGKRNHYQDMKALYAECRACYEKCIRQTQELKNYGQVVDELPMLNARLSLLSTKEIIRKSEHVGDLLYEWSSEFRQGMPKVGDSVISFTPVKEQPHRQRAEELYPSLMEGICTLTELMKTHLESIKA